ncbi:RelA/SpoT family protein [Effusibacillus dendaii]|uniref:GTP pyrophosphokinase n=1 Tax=Effusibacillus dendaii TaxID=2743772 RepID=A0A7I8DD63_9BACL|nr:bifunctional (p)ppGpp synthetase/guanosine-3',5'-bis(diphosphate) 3'-pyrophosphohydrolase [Effusibacillus dendaii]BCJ88138.1 GTP pyrophosphokinase [Effusibacillus dendaii]
MKYSHSSNTDQPNIEQRRESPTGIQQLIKKVDRYGSPADLELINRAYEFAKQAHQGQKRRSGEDYIIHPVAVADILADLELDAATVASALLHDVVEDTEVTEEQLTAAFGTEIRDLVDGVTKLGRLKYLSKEEQQAENLRKMFLAMSKDIRVILIKLADRLHNMRTLKHLPPEKQQRIATETLEIFAPLAHRLGISKIKFELEDIALRYMNPQQYYRIVNLMAKKRQEREQYIQDVIETIKGKLQEIEVTAEVYGRAKHIYSIYRKMTNQNKQFNEIYDLLAVRIIVDSIKDCYAILGIVHTLWKPMPGRFKDYIAMPKQNMYQSLHTTVIGPRGEPLEIQIRTWEMHRTAEYGIAAHWLYKEGKPAQDMSFVQKMGWFREILEWQQDLKDAQEFMETLKIDLFSDEVFVFTPKGAVISLPKGSVPIDFAYRIHTDIGNRTIGSKVNGKIVPLDYKLQTGDIVEILTSKSSFGPSRDWLNIVKSPQAKSKIRTWFKKETREENILKGRELLEREVKKNGLEVSEVLTEKNLSDVMVKFNFTKEDDLLASVGYGAVSPIQVMTRLLEKIRKEQPEEAPVTEFREGNRQQRKGSAGVRVRGVDNMLIRFSRCCNPVPGDEIVGFVTRGRGVSVHRVDCPNVKANDEEEEKRFLEVEWESSPAISYHVDIEVTALDRPRITIDVMNAVAETKTNIGAVQARGDKRKIATISLQITIRNVDHLHTVVERIKRVKDVYTVRRIMQ